MSAETFQTCYVRLPEGFDSTKTYPLLVGLHGVGGTRGASLACTSAPGSRNSSMPCSRRPIRFRLAQRRAYSWVTESESDSTVRRRSSVMSSDFVAEACRRLTGQYHISGTWLLGFSQGCGMAYVTGIRHHDLLKGIIGFGGGFDTLRFSPRNWRRRRACRCSPSHGSEDRVVEPSLRR